MKVFIIFGFVAISISAVCSMTYDIHDISEEWNLFKVKFNKAYENAEEELFRKKLYLENKIKIDEHNKLYKKGQVTYTLRMNQFGDMDHHEWREMNGFNQLLKNNMENRNSVIYSRPGNDDLPDSIDWREKGAVTPVKDQGNCASCWAFSSTGSLEAQNFFKTGKLVSFSEQNLMDCSYQYGNRGCLGGLMEKAFEYLIDNRGIDTEASYPYTAMNGLLCKYNSKNKGTNVQGYGIIPRGSEYFLKDSVGAGIGPVSVAVDATSFGFRFYDNGVYYNPTCSSDILDHAMLVVGYNTTVGGDDYWIVKNSWGIKWGQSGYIWMARNKDNNCGIASLASYPIVKIIIT